MHASGKNTSGRGENGSKLADNCQTESLKNRVRSPKVSKTHSDYWRAKVFKPKKRRGGATSVSKTYSARMSWNGERHSIPLTSNKESAACKAAEIYRHLQRRGWEATLEKYAAHLAEYEEPVGEAPSPSTPITLGEYLREAEAVSTVNPRTFREYCQSLRRIMRESLGMSLPKRGVVGRKFDSDGKVVEKGKRRELSPFDYRSEARRRFDAKVDATPLKALTPGLVNKWKVARVRKVGESPIQKRRAMRTVSGMIRQAKALFSERGVLCKLDLPADLSLPSPLPLEGVVPYTRKEMGRSLYVSTIDAGELLRAAQGELAESEPEAWKILLLGLGAGLRRNEIDKLLWSQVDFEQRAIVIAETPYFRPKTADSAGAVEIDETMVAILRGYRARAKGEFVIESTRELRNESLTDRTYSFVRAEEHFKTLYAWLRAHGVESRKPLHTLRKEAGSIVCQQRDIYAASRFLRHADIQVTAEYYLDKKERVSVAVGALLTPVEADVTRERDIDQCGREKAAS